MRLEDEEYTKLIQQWRSLRFPLRRPKQDQDKAEQWTDTQLQRAVDVLMDKSQGAVGDDDRDRKNRDSDCGLADCGTGKVTGLSQTVPTSLLPTVIHSLLLRRS